MPRRRFLTAIAALILAACAAGNDGSVELTVHRNGSYGIDGQTVSLQELEIRLLTLNAASGHLKVRIVVDRDAEYRDIYSLVEVLSRLGADPGLGGDFREE